MYGLAIAALFVGCLVIIFGLVGVIVNYVDGYLGWLATSAWIAAAGVALFVWGAVTVTDHERQVCEKQGGSWELMQCYPQIHVEVE